MAGAILVVSALQCRCRRVSFCNSDALFFVWVFLSGLGDRDVRPCVPRMHNGRCLASALKCFGPDPLGDASGKFSLVLAYVNAIFFTIVGVMCAPLC